MIFAWIVSFPRQVLMVMRSRRGFLAMLALACSVSASCSSSIAPSPTAIDFILEVEGERFVVRTSHAETIRFAEGNREGRNRRFPVGVLKTGDGGFNGPWTWHLDPASVRFVETAIELCDGRPSYVEAHQTELASYCPWSARVVGRL